MTRIFHGVNDPPARKPPKTANPEKAALKSKLKALGDQLEEETLKRKELEAQLATATLNGKGT